MKRMTMFLLLASLAIAIPHASTAQSAHFASVDIRDFVRQVFFEGVPYSEASRFESSVVPTLLQMLADPREEDHWSNIAVVLEIIGDEGAVDPLIQFIEEGSPGIMSRSEYVARTSALMGLGYLVNGTGNKKALNYLKQSVAPEMWEARFKGIAPYQVSVQERNEDLSTYAILGLALSGHPSAAETLRSLQRLARSASATAFQARINDTVTEALGAHELIAKVGLEKYYQNEVR